MAARQSHTFDIGHALSKTELQAEVHFRTPEDPDEKALRIHKDKISFYFKEVIPYTLGAVFLCIIAAYCTLDMFQPSWPKDDRAWAQTTFTSITTGIIGLIFGKSLK
jgi:hypothetical protein